MANWREIIPTSPAGLIIETLAFKEHLARLEREDGLPRIILRRFADGAEHAIAFEEEAYSLGMSGGYEFDTTDAALHLFVDDHAGAGVRLRHGRAHARAAQDAGGAERHNPDDYVTRPAAGARRRRRDVPVSVLYRKGTPLDGSAPLFLYGYGSYGISIPASFSTTRLSLVDRGFVFAIAHIRGGKDKGYRWYTDGKLKKKMHTFTDFIAAGELSVQQRYTSRGRIVANGGSAGRDADGRSRQHGAGAVPWNHRRRAVRRRTQHHAGRDPAAHPARVAGVGQSHRVKEDFDIIRSYSPYDNLAAKAYPHIFAFAGLTDPRVTYWEPAKWIARLRHLNTSSNMILLKTNMEAGHGGASGRFEALKELATDYAFALKITERGRRLRRGCPADVPHLRAHFGVSVACDMG
jgi:oligopeptidase B